jgi:hypothetical protein
MPGHGWLSAACAASYWLTRSGLLSIAERPSAPVLSALKQFIVTICDEEDDTVIAIFTKITMEKTLSMNPGEDSQWWKSSGLRRLVLWQACLLVSQMVVGYDEVVVGSFQSMDA